MEMRYNTKPDISGAATFMQGYAALEGLGMTRSRNQAVETIPIRKNKRRGGILHVLIRSLIDEGFP
jgi:hypothetical protein